MHVRTCVELSCACSIVVVHRYWSSHKTSCTLGYWLIVAVGYSLKLERIQVASHLDALGWEQAAPGIHQTAQYWQFTPHEDDVDICSLGSQHSNNVALTRDSASHLHTPARPSENQGRGDQQHTPLTSVVLPAISPQPASAELSYTQFANSHSSRGNSDEVPCSVSQAQRQLSLQQQDQQEQLQFRHARPLEEHTKINHQSRQLSRTQQDNSPTENADAAGPQLLSQPPSAAWDLGPAPHIATASACPPVQAVPSATAQAAAVTNGKFVLKQGLSEPAGKTTSFHAALLIRYLF